MISCIEGKPFRGTVHYRCCVSSVPLQWPHPLKTSSITSQQDTESRSRPKAPSKVTYKYVLFPGFQGYAECIPHSPPYPKIHCVPPAVGSSLPVSVMVARQQKQHMRG